MSLRPRREDLARGLFRKCIDHGRKQGHPLPRLPFPRCFTHGTGASCVLLPWTLHILEVGVMTIPLSVFTGAQSGEFYVLPGRGLHNAGMSSSVAKAPLCSCVMAAELSDTDRGRNRRGGIPFLLLYSVC